MEQSFRSLLIFLAGLAILFTALALDAIVLESGWWMPLLGLAGLALVAFGSWQLRAELTGLIKRRRGEIATFTVGVIGVLVVIAYFSTRYSARLDLSEAGLHSLSEQTTTMLKKLENPVHVTYFHDRGMRETVELYKLMARQTDKLTVDFFNPMLNPAQARLRGVKFSGTAIFESGGRSFEIHSPEETDIANGILRVSIGAQQTVCFLDGHGEADPFSLESHDHSEGAAGHSHGAGSKTVVHETHGMAKARNSLEAMNYVVKKVALTSAEVSLGECTVLVVAGPKTRLLPGEIDVVIRYLENGGNALFMLDPFVATGLEELIRSYGIVVDNDIIIDEKSHYWADISSPAVTQYNRHQITRDLPLTFFPGARSLSPTPNRVPGTSVIPLVASSRVSFGEVDPNRIEYDEKRDLKGPDNTGMIIMVTSALRPQPVDADMTVTLQEGTDLPSPIIEGTAQSRIAVIGDSDFATNSFFHILGNANLFLNTVNYLAEQENLIGIEPRTYDPPSVNLTNRQMKGTFLLSVILVPALLAVIGIAVWWRQR